MCSAWRLAVLAIFLFAVHASSAADWPTYRANAARTGFTPESLAETLELRWTYSPSHAPEPAWPRSERLTQDRAYHVVVAGGTAYFGSSVDGKVYAIDAATGQARWSFFTEGPVRYAPTVWQDRLFAVSDDGHLYALSLADGSLLWKRRGGPDSLLRLGNERMISKWPARGAAVVVDDIVYFVAGIWPSDGIFLYGLDARTGEVVWKNDDSGHIDMPQPHGGANAESGISAQGYLAAADTPGEASDAARQWLLVPTGRAVPAAFNRASGEFEYFHLQQFGHKGGAPLMADHGMFFNSGIAFDLASGQATHTLGDGALASTRDGIVLAKGSDVSGLRWTEVEKPDRRGNVVKTPSLESLWTAKNVDAGAEIIVAGERVVAGGAGRVTLLGAADGEVTWTAEVDGVARGLAVADARLFVSTDAGTIFCFGPVEDAAALAVKAQRDDSPYPKSAELSSAAEEILRVSKVTEGYCLDLGCGDGQLAYELAKTSDLQIVAVDSNRALIDRARRRLDSAGLLGSRVSVFHVDDLSDTGLPSYFADLVLSRRSAVDGTHALSDDSESEAFRSLRPYGGVLVAGKSGTLRIVRRGALAGAGNWTHQYTNAANTLCSADQIVKGPLGMLWFRDVDMEMPQRHGRGPAPLFYEGRLYSEGLDELACVDAYNGRVLWRYPLPGILKAYDGDELMGAAGTNSNYCLSAAGIFVRRAGHCLQIDLETGELLRQFEAPPQANGKPGIWGYIACEGDRLYGSLADAEHTVTFRYRETTGDMKSLLTESLTLFALDARSGKLLWRYDAADSIRHNAIAIGGDSVYLIDRPQAEFDRDKKGTGKQPLGVLVALNAGNGEVLWKTDDNIDGTMLALSTAHNTLLMSYQPTRFALVSESGDHIAAFEASSGRMMWDKHVRYSSRPLINDYTIYAQGGAWDLRTGEDRPFNFSRSYGCGVLAGSQHMMVYRSGTLGFFDLNRNEKTENFGGVRPGCWINAIPVGGIVLVPDATAGCRCSYLNRSWFALEPHGVRAPAIEPAGGGFHAPVEVRLKPDDASHKVHYTLDGTPPTRNSPLFEGTVTLASTAVFKTRAFDADGNASRTAEARFVIDPHIVPLDDAHWRVWDNPRAVGGASEWSVQGGTVRQSSNIYDGNAAATDASIARYGTLRILNDAREFADGVLELEFNASDDDTIGLAFRLQDEERHYLWSADLQRKFHTLAVKNGAEYKVLARNEGVFKSGSWHSVRVVTQGDQLEVWFDGEREFAVKDATFANGTIALHSWGNDNVQFRSVRLSPRN